MNEFAKGLADMLAEMNEREEERRERWRAEQTKKPGVNDTITLTRLDFRDAVGRGFSVDGSNTADGVISKIGRLVGIRALIGKDNLINLNGLFADLIEEYLFGPVDGEPSPYRITEDNGTEKDGE